MPAIRAAPVYAEEKTLTDRRQHCRHHQGNPRDELQIQKVLGEYNILKYIHIHI